MTCKFHAVRHGREEAIAKSWPNEQEQGIKAYQVDKLARGNKVQKVIVTLMRRPCR